MRTPSQNRAANTREKPYTRFFSGKILLLIGCLVLVGVSVSNSSADDTKPKLSFPVSEEVVTIPYGEAGIATLEVIVKPVVNTELTLNYEISSDEVTADDIEPFGEASIVIPASSDKAAITLNIKTNPAWLEGTKIVQIELTTITPDGVVEFGEHKVTELTITRTPPHVFFPIVSRNAEWDQIDNEAERQNVRSLAVCPNDESVTYLGTDDGLFKWQDADMKWEQVTDSEGNHVPGSVREIKFGADCDHAYAAILDDGVWRTEDGAAWKRIDPQPVGDALLSSRTVEVRENLLFTGTDSGVYYYDLGPDGEDEWFEVDDLAGKVIARLTKAESRIFVAIWTEGVAYNDTCTDDSCSWKTIPGPADDKLVREVIGRSPESPDDSPSWMLFATASTIYWWNGQEWVLASPAPQPTGNIFSLVQEDEKIFAGTENSGVWTTTDDGHSWEKVPASNTTIQNATIRDMVIDKTGKLVVATFEDGVWVWR